MDGERKKVGDIITEGGESKDLEALLKEMLPEVMELISGLEKLGREQAGEFRKIARGVGSEGVGAFLDWQSAKEKLDQAEKRRNQKTGEIFRDCVIFSGGALAVLISRIVLDFVEFESFFHQMDSTNASSAVVIVIMVFISLIRVEGAESEYEKKQDVLFKEKEEAARSLYDYLKKVKEKVNKLRDKNKESSD